MKKLLRINLPLAIITIGSLVFIAGCGSNTDSGGNGDSEYETGHDHEMHNHEMHEEASMDDAKMSQEKDGKPSLQKTCPVMGEPINNELYVDHAGKRIYVCCKACLSKVKADPKQYLKKIEDMDERPHSVPE